MGQDRQASAFGHLVLTDTVASFLKGLLPLKGVKITVFAKATKHSHKGVVPLWLFFFFLAILLSL